MTEAPPSHAVALTRGTAPWLVPHAAHKLAERAGLPGAYGYDQSAHAVRVARAKGVPLATLLPVALPGSWMVNSKAISRVFQRWLHAPLRDEFEALLALLEGGPDVWLSRSTLEREQVTAHVLSLCIDGHGVAALSKALALLVPETVPLMDDAALWFAGLRAEAPATADAPECGGTFFVPMLDWFSRAVLAAEPALIALARGHKHAVLDAAQVYDRLLWFESWGHRYSHHAATKDRERWWWVADADREAIVQVHGPHPSLPPGARVLTTDPMLDPAWVERARAALRAA